MPKSHTRRSGYAPSNPGVGRRGLHTRDAILSSAAELFVIRGFHGTSIDAIAKSVGGSRATVYQYFEDKDDIYRALADRCAPAVLEHAAQLTHIGPDAEGTANLLRWLDRWAELYDNYAVVFLEFPGVGTLSSVHMVEANPASEQYESKVSARLSEAGVDGIDPADAAAAMIRMAHMVNLYRYRGMFGLPSTADVSASLAVALQLLLFPETPDRALTAIAGPGGAPAAVPTAATPPPRTSDSARISPIRTDILAASSALFAEHGYHSVAMEDIAAAASIGRATLYRHFSTKLAILSELTESAVAESQRIATELHGIADSGDLRALQPWLSGYVQFHLRFAGVIRTWYDRELSSQLADAVSQGMGPFLAAASALLTRTGLPPGIEPRVGAVIFLSVLGRLSELAIARFPHRSDEDTVALMLLVFSRALRLPITR